MNKILTIFSALALSVSVSAQNNTIQKAAQASSQNIIINEIMAANVDVYRDPSTNFGSWVELYNPTSQAVTLGGLYVTDDAENLKKHRLISSYGTLPANGFALLNFDHHEPFTANSYRQIPDKLICDGGTIIISDGETILAQQSYPSALSRIAYARTTDGGDTWSNTYLPTPGKSNQLGGGFASEQLPAPVVDTNSRYINGTIRVNVEIPAGATLRYTTDGTTPTHLNGSTSTTGSFTVSNTTVYRFRLYQTGKLPSTVVTRSYITNTGNYVFPAISLVTNRYELNLDGRSDNQYAIFSYSSNGRPGNGQSSAFNANMDWERPVNFEYFTESGEVVVNQECDLSSCGGWSRAWTPHSFKLKANKIYDLKNSFDYQFFSEKPYLKHKTLQIRNGGNDNGCRIKDASIQGVVASSGLYIDHQAWQPVHVFLNGTHIAVINMREPNNKHYGSANYGIDTDFMDQFEICPDSCYVQKEGTKDSFNQLLSLSAKASDPATYEEIKKLLDIDEYINYMAVELYIGNSDWPQNNVKGFRDQNDGRFHFVLFDTDHTFGTSTPFTTFENKKNYTFDSRYGYDYSKGRSISGSRLTLENPIVTLFLNMLNNDSFRKQFIDSFCLVAGSVFEPGRVSDVVSQMSRYLNTGNFVNSTSTANTVISSFSNRQSAMITQLRNYKSMKLTSATAQPIKLSSNISEGRITVNDMEVPTGNFSGSLFSPIKLKASAPAGYKFGGWAMASSTGTGNTIIANGSEWKYYDAGSLDNKAWKYNEFTETNWKTGKSPIGYGKTQNTETAKNLPTYYFRKKITISNPKDDDVYTLNWIADDGFIVYVNSVEAGRYNMPAGTPTYNTYATSYAPNNPDTGTMELDPKLFKVGTNVIAVEVHNNSATSTDILWECSLTRDTHEIINPTYVSNDQEYTLPTSGGYSLVAYWEKMTDEEMRAEKQRKLPVVINEVSADNSMYLNDYFKKDDWVELYNTTDEPINVAGYYLSDNVSKPTKYKIASIGDESTTTIPPHGYLIVWGSKRADKGASIHGSFKFDNTDGSCLMLTSPDQSWTDTLTYVAHGGMESVGRYPDGGNEIYHFFTPTICKSNKFTTDATWIATQVYEDLYDGIDAILSETSGVASTSYHRIDGVATPKPTERGIYVVTQRLADGRTVNRKVVIR